MNEVKPGIAPKYVIQQQYSLIFSTLIFCQSYHCNKSLLLCLLQINLIAPSVKFRIWAIFLYFMSWYSLKNSTSDVRRSTECIFELRGLFCFLHQLICQSATNNSISILLQIPFMGSPLNLPNIIRQHNALSASEFNSQRIRFLNSTWRLSLQKRFQRRRFIFSTHWFKVGSSLWIGQ